MISATQKPGLTAQEVEARGVCVFFWGSWHILQNASAERINEDLLLHTRLKQSKGHLVVILLNHVAYFPFHFVMATTPPPSPPPQSGDVWSLTHC
jgi:hypothetical protein